MDEARRKKLLVIARSTLESFLKDGKKPALKENDPELLSESGVFVTLTKNGELRGCIGLIKGIKPLYLAVQEMVVAAATGDPRFPSVRHDELKNIEIEISVISPFAQVNDASEIEVGRDGLYIMKDGCSGLLLPQVPGEYGWDRETFLKNLCRKAGLPDSAWREPDAKLFSFTADVFHE